MQTFDVIVLGVGGVGSAALDQLAQRGVRAVGIDRFPPGHASGSSHGQTRIIRQAYFEHPDYVPLLLESWRLWRELEARRREQLLFEVGLIQVGPPDGEVVPGVLKAARLYDLAVEELSGPEVENTFPGFSAPQPLVGVFERQAGYLLVERAVMAQAAEAERPSAQGHGAQGQGAQLRSGETVISWRSQGDGVVVETDRDRYSAGRLIVSAGAWSGPLVDRLTPRLNVIRKQVQWYRAADGAYSAAKGAPTFLYELPEGVFYGFPQIDERGVKVAEHTSGSAVPDPLLVDRGLDAGDCDRATAFCRQYMPQLTGEVLGHSVCMYTMTPDQHFIVDRHPDHAQVAFAAGLSGHGFKFVPVLGKILVDLALDGRTALPIDFLSCRRAGL
jgi:sarcosine oxidase